MEILGVLLFAAAWLGMGWLFAVQSGWQDLAAQFPATSGPSGQPVRWQVIREIVYRLLTGAQAGRLRHLATFAGHAHRMVRAVEKFRMNFNKPLRIEEVARERGMSVSGFHAHFRAVTAMSPLQFQKQQRLQEARRLMLNEDLDAADAGYRVGYDDASHFNREYKRHFGEPPMRDVGRMRELATAG